MLISLIAAMADNGVIGKDGKMPWHLPEDLRYFKAQTLGKPVIMGRKTWESIGAKPLPGRDNFVISRNPDYNAEGAIVVGSLDEALSLVEWADEVMIAGGGQIYAEALALADRLYLTEVHIETDGDARFPAFNGGEWVEISREDRTDGDTAYSFVVLDRSFNLFVDEIVF